MATSSVKVRRWKPELYCLQNRGAAGFISDTQAQPSFVQYFSVLYPPALTKSKKNTESELEATDQYLKDLQKACVSGDSSYEDRKEARATEIEALQKVQGILTDAFKEEASAAAGFLQRSKAKRV